MKRFIGTFTIGFIFCFLMSFPISAADSKGSPSPPDLTKGDVIDHSITWTLGPTGARGWIHKYENKTEHARQIFVTEVHQGSPADGLLKKGDVILGVDGKAFSDDPRRIFAMAITEAERKERGGRLELIRWRDGQTQNVAIQLEVMGSFSPTAPYDCDKTQNIIDLAVKAIIKDGLDNGNPDPIDGDGIPGLFNALGLMATGRSDVMPLVKAKMRELTEKPIDGMKWGHAWTLITLSEYFLLTQDKSVLPSIEKYALETAKGQSIAGTWGHGFASHDGIMGGYGAMNQVALAHTLGLLLAEKSGIDQDVIKKALKKSIAFFDYYTGKGGVPYGAHDAAARFGPDNNGKSSAAAIIFNLHGDPKATDFFARMSVHDYGGIEVGHASNFFHLPWQGLGCANLGIEAAASHLRECRWYYELLRDWRGKFRHHEDPNHNEPNKFWDATGARLLFYSLPLKKLYITGKGGYLPSPVKGDELEKVIESGRHRGKYHTLTENQLLERIKDWCHTTRFRATEELAKREGDWVTPGLVLLKEGSLIEKYGGTRLMENLKDKAAPAVSTLEEHLTHPDLWLRIRSAFALQAIGKKAETAIPSLMKAVKITDPLDHRHMFHRALSLTLFDKKKGLLRSEETLSQVPKKDLVEILGLLIKNEEAQSVTALQVPLRFLSFDDLKPLWPSIVYRIEHRLSENVMFAGMQAACIDLLAEHKVEEGLRLSAYMMNTQNGWGSGRRNKQILASLLKYGSHAERALFPLQNYLTKNLGFSEPLQEFKTQLAQSPSRPPLVSISPWLGNYEIGDHFEMLTTLEQLNDKVSKDGLPQYWEVYEIIQKLLVKKPEWGKPLNKVLGELMTIPRAKDIIDAHLAINAIKEACKAKKLSREETIQKLLEYRDKYDINIVGPNLVYWFSQMAAGRLKSGKDLK